MAPTDTCGDYSFDAVEQRRKVVGQVGGDQAREHSSHPATDVNANTSWDHGALGWDHRTDGGTEPDMSVGHQGDVTADDWEPSRSPCLLQRLVFKAIGPDLQILTFRLHLFILVHTGEEGEGIVGCAQPGGCKRSGTTSADSAEIRLTLPRGESAGL